MKTFGRFLKHRTLPTPAPPRQVLKSVVPGMILLTLAAAIFLAHPFTAAAIERRKPQFLTEPSYLFFPLPYSLPGIGSGIVFTALAGNVFETNLDVFALAITGDAEGSFFGVEDIHIISETLILDFARQGIDKALVNNYDQRGMNSDGEQFTLIELSQADSNEGRATLSLFDRRLEIFAGIQTQQFTVPRIRDQDGNILTELTPPFTQKSKTTFQGFVIDYTDDRQDPRAGIRLEVTRSNTPPDSNVDADFFVWNYNLTGYIPIGDINTLVINYFQSDAQVTRPGVTDPVAIRAELGFFCGVDPVCLKLEQELVDQFIAMRSKGTATDLGGDTRLRSYPQSRFTGAHTIFYAVEFRWNISSEVTPFNYFIWKDVRTGLQVAIFAERGSVGETHAEVGDVYASSVGAGFRLISASGFVYRADIATGKEGTEAVIIFNYPF